MTNTKQPKSFRWITLATLLFIIPIVIGTAYYTQMPEQMLIHFDAHNVPDNFAHKNFALFGIPALLCLLNFVVYALTKWDPKRVYQSPKVQHMVLLLIPIISIAMQFVMIQAHLHEGFNVGRYVLLLVSVVTIIIGNYLPKSNQNYTIGIRLPWTLQSEENWRKTHRFAGLLWIVSGLAMLLVTMFNNIVPLLFFGIFVCIIAVVPIVYSAWLYGKEKKKNE